MFIYSSVMDIWAVSHLWDVMNNAVVNVMWVHGYLSPRIYLGVELMGHEDFLL